jgi:hypothetical protein
MNTIKKTFVRLFLLNKRMLKKISFLLILCIIPVLTVAMTFFAREESGVLNILLCTQDKNDAVSNEIINGLLDGDNIISFSKCDDIGDAYDRVKTGVADAVWIFKDNLQQRIDKYVSDGKENNAFVTVVERETNISLQLSHEKLCGAVFPYVSYSVFDNFLYTEIFTVDEITKEQIKKAYDSAIGGGDLVTFESVSGETKGAKTNYLTAPLRGLLSLVIVLCGLASVMYHQSDRENRIYDWMPKTKHIEFGFASCISAVFDSAVFVVLALTISELSMGAYEILSAIVFMFATTAFCLLVGCITKKSSVTGKIMPFLMIILLVVSPIFFNLNSLQGMQMLFPTYYYLYSVYSPIHILYMAIYSVVVYVIVFAVNYVTEKNA